MNNDFTNMEPFYYILDPQLALYMLLAVVLFFIGKLFYDRFTPYSLNHQLTKLDNKAIAVTFSGYLLGLGIIIFGVLNGDSTETFTYDQLLKDCGATLLWGSYGIILLHIAGWINDKALLHKFCNIKELIEDKNIGTGAVMFGSYVGTAFIIKGSLTGDANDSLVMALLSALIYFLAGQFAFILFGTLYDRITRFKLHDEIEADNIAAGTAYGMNLVAVGVLIGGFIAKYDSLPALGLWFVISAFLLVTCRYLVDKLILPGSLLDDEIATDHNWGAALIEGAAAISLAFILTTLF